MLKIEDVLYLEVLLRKSLQLFSRMNKTEGGGEKTLNGP